MREFERGTLGVPGIAAVYGYRASGLTPGLHRGLPSQYVTFIISLDGPIETAASEPDFAAGVAARNEVVVGGLHTAPAYVTQPERQAGIQLAVHPLAARQIFGVPVSELRSLTHEGAEVLGDGVSRLREQLHDLPTWAERFAALRAFTLRRAEASRYGPRREVAAAWKLLNATGGAATAAQLSDNVGVSARHLNALFRQETGVTAKDVARLIRFDNAVNLVGARMRAGRRTAFADVAAACGFYDQAHLVREFHRFAGTSPTNWLAEESPNLKAGGHDRRPEHVRG